MKKVFFAALSASALIGTGVAFAQGLPAGTQPQTYGSVWAAQQKGMISQGSAGATNQLSAERSRDNKLAGQTTDHTTSHTP